MDALALHELCIILNAIFISKASLHKRGEQLILQYEWAQFSWCRKNSQNTSEKDFKNSTVTVLIPKEDHELNGQGRGRGKQTCGRRTVTLLIQPLTRAMESMLLV